MDSKISVSAKTSCSSTHATLAPSASSRWLECTPSAVAERGVADEGSSYASEGTLAHALGARSLKELLGLPTDSEQREIEALSGQWLCGEMEEHAEGYAGHVNACLAEAGKDATLMVEQRVDFSDWVPDGHGTADALIVAEGTLHVIDLKYGKGVKVLAPGNPQLRLYALGALSLFEMTHGIEEVRMTIFQPRLSHISTDSLPASELLRWAEEEVRPKAMLASKGLGVRHSGEWCRFCKVRSSCRRLALDSMQTFTMASDSGEMSPEEMASLLPELPKLTAWATAVKERSLKWALEGGSIPGYKVVEGARRRKVADPESLARILTEAGFSEEDFLKPREMASITALDKLVGKKRLADLAGDSIRAVASTPTLVPDSDKREPMDARNDFDMPL